MNARGFFRDWRVHVLCLILVIIAEMIGIIPIKWGMVSFALLPMLFALILGIFVSKLGYNKVVTDADMEQASSYIGISVMYLIAFMSSSIGPNLDTILNAGPALILQEFGNLGTIFLSMPIAMLFFKMDRTAIGSAFSNSREGSLAIVGTMYGLDSPEGRGVMGSYITGTLLGTIFCGILASLLANVTWFSPESLAMAAGTGSASMMSAAIAPLVEQFPEKADELMSYAATSQVLTSADGMYVSIFLAIPLTEWLYKKFKGKEFYEKEKAEVDAQRKIEQVNITEEGEIKAANPWPIRLKVLFYSGIFAMVAMYIASAKKGTPLFPQDTLPGMLWLFGIVVVGTIVGDFVQKLGLNLPTVLFIALIASIASVPGLWPGAESYLESMKNISLLPLCTPILAYAGISTGKDVDAFRKQGFKIIMVTLCALAGTYVGSAVIANVVLKVTGAL
ncbi:MAG: DUF3100 domain-containing protein [Tissierellia bacterium]|nr:DUF3100 domain-containing protein [Tissierellia bacterium]